MSKNDMLQLIILQILDPEKAYQERKILLQEYPSFIL
jgi:hypothetical protein